MCDACQYSNCCGRHECLDCRALSSSFCLEHDPEVERRIADARDEALEEAAKVVEHEGRLAEQREEWFEAPPVARRIRALKSKKETP